MTDFVTVTTTTDNPDEARRLSGSAVEARLAACGQVSSAITSTYWWEGKIETATEYRVDFKTRSELAAALVLHLTSAHSYDTPEVIVTPIESGNPAYLTWITAQTGGE